MLDTYFSPVFNTCNISKFGWFKSFLAITSDTSASTISAANPTPSSNLDNSPLFKSSKNSDTSLFTRSLSPLFDALAILFSYSSIFNILSFWVPIITELTLINPSVLFVSTQTL